MTFRRPNRRRRKQRGIILLIVLSLLVIFTLMATTFVIVSGNYRSAAELTARLSSKKFDPRKLTDDVLFSLVADTEDPQSPMRGHSLLRDMYGDDGFTARVLNWQQIPPTNTPTGAVQVGQFFDLQLNIPLPSAANFLHDVPRDYQGRIYIPRVTADYYNGCVLTFVDGPAQGMSTRVIDYDPNGAVFRVMPIEGNAANPPGIGDRVVINGRPFSGSGFGFNPLTSQNDGADPGPDGEWGIAGNNDDGDGVADNISEALAPGSDDIPLIALQPNRIPGVSIANNTINESRTSLVSYLWGGADESYDVADYQNVHLAAIIPNATNPNRTIVLPSFHRPAMINWWVQQFVVPLITNETGTQPSLDQALLAFLLPYGRDHVRNSPDDPTFISLGLRDQIVILKRRIIMRPLPETNPNFNGGNQTFVPTFLAAAAAVGQNPYVVGPWDIDNDGDGDPDSIWLDVGMPIQEDPQGRLYKPLAAILCTDLDGRLNINAQGGQGHLAALLPTLVTHPQNLARNQSFAALTPGSGTGPADTNLGVLFGPLYDRLLVGSGPPALPRRITGRYGFDGLPGLPGPSSLNPNITNDFLALTKFYQFPPNYHDMAGTVSARNVHRAFESPPDLWGEVMVGLDHRGQPQYTVQNPTRNLLVDHPYEKNLLTADRSDELYTIAELEGLLRFHDDDVNPADGQPIPQRLTQLFEVAPGQNLFTSPDPVPPFPTNPPANFFPALNRRLITTHSFDLPVPNMFEPADLGVFNPANPLHRILRPHAFSNNNFRFHHVSEILRARLIQGFGWGDQNVVLSWNQTAEPHDTRLNLATLGFRFPGRDMLSADLRMGLRMDINRQFGNGVDDNNNGVIDEHGFGILGFTSPFWNLEASIWSDRLDNNGNGAVDELGEEEGLWANAARFDHDNDGNVNRDQDAFLARAHYARHLYLLLMMLKDPQYFTKLDVDGDGDVGATDPTDTALLYAQWAVNAVDFRDADSVMTPFEFDLTPFTPQPGPDGAWGKAGVDDDGINGTDDPGEALWSDSDDLPPWGVDGFVGTDDDTSLDRGLVWGLERPELLITETLAFHDRRTEDLSTDPSGRTTTDSEPDPHFDQRLRPWGSFYVELYNPWASESLRKPAEFYSGTTKLDGLLLDKLTPVHAQDPSLRSPVWRLLVMRGELTGDGTPRSVDAPYDSNRPTPDETDRVIYFAGVGHPAGTAEIYTSPAMPPPTPSPFAPLRGGRYAVVGTSRKTIDLPEPPEPIGSGATNRILDWVNPIGRRIGVIEDALETETTRRIVLQPSTNPDLNRVYVEDNGDIALPRFLGAATIADAMAPVAIPIPGLNVTENQAEYSRLATAAGSAFEPSLAGDEGAYDPPLDEPLDVAGYLTQDGMFPFGTKADDDTTWNKVVHLQRLANPLLPWNPYRGEADHDSTRPVNPYLTVDTAAIDLASFNGVTDDSTDPINSGELTGFFSRQRGEAAPTGTPPRALWKQDDWLLGTARGPTPTTVLDHHVTHALHHSLGYLNDSPARPIYGPRFRLDPGDAANSTAPTPDYIGAPDTQAGVGPPFPWLTWLNRPYTSQYELQLVPRSSSFDLLGDWSAFDSSRAKAAYEQTGPNDPRPAEFHHLLNFYSSTKPGSTGPGSRTANLAQLFEFTYVPSQFVGTDTLLNPSVFGNPNGAVVGTESLHPPFNRVSKYREPGKINLNTVYAPVVVDAIRGASFPLGVGPLFNQIVDSRRGFGERPNDPTGPFPPERRTDAPTSWIRTGTQVPSFDPTSPEFDPVTNTVPTVFANPFRGYGEGPLSPMPRWQRPFIEATLLRSNRIDWRDLNVTDAWPQPPQAPVPDGPLFARTTGQPHISSARNPYFRYDAMQRFANLTTSRSNVYAIWITVGFFEVENVPPTPLNPFGYRLGSELGWDTGQVRRHRGFYVVDRSVPVAFEPGKRHNVERAILLRRFIE